MSKTVGPGYAGTTPTRPATSTTSATVLAANANRTGFVIVNDSAGKLYLSFSASAASATAYTVVLAAGAVYEQRAGSSTYAGPIQGVLDTGSGNAQVTSW